MWEKNPILKANVNKFFNYTNLQKSELIVFMQNKRRTKK
jgi:hypothetical protein